MDSTVSSPQHSLDSVTEQFLHFMQVSMPRQAASVAEMGLTVHQFRALIYALLHEGATTSDLAEFVGVHPSVATGIVQRLVERELIERAEDPTDRRVRRLHLSAQGRTFIEEAMGTVRAQRREQFSALSQTQLSQLGGILATLTHAIEDGSTPPHE